MRSFLHQPSDDDDDDGSSSGGAMNAGNAADDIHDDDVVHADERANDSTVRDRYIRGRKSAVSSSDSESSE
jgi:hypothetical protein